MLNDIKETSKYVVENSKYVKINYSVLEQFLNKIDCSDIKNWLTYNPYGLLNLDVESIVNFLVVFEAIDYSFWGYPKWTVSTEEGFKDGSDALLYTLLNYTKKKGTDFSKIDKNEFNNILKGNVQKENRPKIICLSSVGYVFTIIENEYQKRRPIFNFSDRICIIRSKFEVTLLRL